MCFSATHSAAFAAVGLATALFLRVRGRSWKYVGLALYFSVMEVRAQTALTACCARCGVALTQPPCPLPAALS